MKQYMTTIFVLTVGFLLLVGNAAGAIEETKLIALDGKSGDWFGWSVAVDEDTAVIGAHRDDDAFGQSGSVYVFPHSGGTWTQQTKLNANDGAAEDNFGHSVSVDGDTVVIGSPYDDDAGSASGSAYVYSLGSTDGNAPVAFDDSYSVNENTGLNVTAPGVLGNDNDLEGDTLNAILINSTTNGILALNGDGSFSYTPNPDFNGTDSFTYKANDGYVDSGEVTVTITVNSVNEPPEFIDVPALTTLGIIGLVGLLGIISVVRIKRRL